MTYSLGDLLILTSSEWPHLQGALGVSAIHWEEIIAYLPFANAFSLDTPFPLAPSYDQELSGLSVFPTISFLISGLLLNCVALGNLNFFLLFCHGVLPVLNFWLAYLIFSRFVSKTWAILLALLGTGYFSGFHFGPAAMNALNSGDWSSIFYARIPEISRFPFPGISLACFLFPFLATIGSTGCTKGRLIGLSLLWGVQIHVYAFNFIAGAVFFTLWIPYQIRKSKGILDLRLVLSRWAIFFLISGACVAPFLVALKSAVGQQLLDKMFAAEASSPLLTSDWGWFASHALPLLLLAFTFVVFRVDKHELFHRFGPVFLALAVDLFVGALPFISGGSIDSELYFHRISNLFFRYLYFLPFLHFISIQRPIRRIPHDKIWTKFREKVASFCHKSLHEPRIAWTTTGIAIFCGFVWGNAFAIQSAHEKNVVVPMTEIQKQFDLAAELELEPNTIVVFEDLVSSLLTPSMSPQVSLLTSAASNQINEARILERILLHAKIFEWDEERLAEFFEPNPTFAEYDSFKGRQLVTRALIEPGLGNWLLNYKKNMKPTVRQKQLTSILEQFQNINISELLAAHPVSAVIIKKNESHPPKGFVTKAEKSGYTILVPPTISRL